MTKPIECLVTATCVRLCGAGTRYEPLRTTAWEATGSLSQLCVSCGFSVSCI